MTSLCRGALSLQQSAGAAARSMDSFSPWISGRATKRINMKTVIRLHIFQYDVVRFVFAGSLNTGLGFALYCGGIYIGLPYYTSNIIAWSVGVIVSFLLNLIFVFKARFRAWNVVGFAALNFASLCVSLILLTFFIRYVHLDAVFASVICIPIIVILNFTVSKHIVFKPS